MSGSISRSGIFEITFTGGNGVSAISVPGLKVGDTVLRVWQPSSPAAHFLDNLVEAVVSTDDELAQLSGDDYTSATLKAVLVRLG